MLSAMAMKFDPRPERRIPIDFMGGFQPSALNCQALIIIHGSVPEFAEKALIRIVLPVHLTVSSVTDLQSSFALYSRRGSSMKKWTLRGAYTILAVLIVAGLGYHLGLRSWCLHWGTTEAEAHATLPADDLFPVYTAEATHAITIHASPEKVWPWIMQIGQDRSGFYSCTFWRMDSAATCPRLNMLYPTGSLAPREKPFGSAIPNVLGDREE